MFRRCAWADCFEGSVAGVNATETGNEVSQPTLEFTSLIIASHSPQGLKRNVKDKHKYTGTIFKERFPYRGI